MFYVYEGTLHVTNHPEAREMAMESVEENLRDGVVLFERGTTYHFASQQECVQRQCQCVAGEEYSDIQHPKPMMTVTVEMAGVVGTWFLTGETLMKTGDMLVDMLGEPDINDEMNCQMPSWAMAADMKEVVGQ